MVEPGDEGESPRQGEDGVQAGKGMRIPGEEKGVTGILGQGPGNGVSVSVSECEYPWLPHSQFPLCSCTAGPCLKWPKEALDQLKRKQRVNSYFIPPPP